MVPLLCCGLIQLVLYFVNRRMRPVCCMECIKKDRELPNQFRGTHRPTSLHAYGITHAIYYRTLGVAVKILSCAYGQQIAQGRRKQPMISAMFLCTFMPFQRLLVLVSILRRKEWQIFSKSQNASLNSYTYVELLQIHHGL